ncbi:hypothetical protein [Pantoea sp. 1B4]|uniref:hypothetical protein n=1 Tax=Pantoea sp. 1B4 TaxID=2804760 RepID=UPI001AAA39BD|nr:hypothetical protein [Pantoea sp. 1B4]MBN1090625.1 hypothetical protein [Pantoea sp. 1B4]
MEQKDQRLEVRIPGQMVDKLDEIRTRMDFTPSRSDLVRTFIEQGIADFALNKLSSGQKNADKEKKTEIIPLASRFMIYFQIIDEDADTRFTNGQQLMFRLGDVVREVYFQRWYWFAELSGKVLDEVHNSFRSPSVLSLLNDEPVIKTCQDLIFVLNVKRMFDDICDVMNLDSMKYIGELDYDHVSKRINAIIKMADEMSIPLKFYGFPPEENRLIQMYEFVEYADKPKIFGRSINRPRYLTSAEDIRENYALMLNVYNEIRQSGKPFDCDSLDAMIIKIAHMPEWPLKLF